MRFLVQGITALAIICSASVFAVDPWATEPNTNGNTNAAPAGQTRFSNMSSGTSVRGGARRSLATDPNTGINQSEAANVAQAAATPDATGWWAPHLYKYFIGYEGAISGGPLLANSAVAVGYWMGPRVGFEFYLGFTRATGAYSEQTATVTDAVNNNQQLTTTYSGDLSVPQITLGVAPKYRFYQNDWVQIAFGVVVSVTPAMSTTYNAGVKAVSTNNLDTPNTQTVSETGYGQKQIKQDWMLQAGPRLNAEFYVKWFPHLAMGLETGIIGTFGGYQTTTTNLRTRSYAVINGVEQPAGADSSTVTATTPKPGPRAGTFGIGGSAFSFTGVFTIRYVW